MNLMKYLWPGILSRYILRNFLPPFFVGLFFFTFTVLIFYLKEVIRSAVEKGIDPFMVLKLFVYSMGWTVGLTIPMSALMAAIMSIGQLNSDSEIIAMRAGGITYPRIFRPLLIFGFIVSGSLVWFNQQGIPFCLSEMEKITRQILQYDPTAVVEEGQFTRLDKESNMERHIYIEKLNNDKKSDRYGTMSNIQIRKTENVDGVFRLTELITAPEGKKILKKNEKGLEVKALRLYHGYIFRSNKQDKTFQRIDFRDGHLDINIVEDDPNNQQVRPPSIQALNYDQLREEIKRHEPLESEEAQEKNRQLQLEMQKRIALPFATVAFVLLGFPLGIVNRRSGKGMGFGVSILFIFIYYVIFLSSDTLAVKKQTLDPVTAAWLANVVIVLIGGFIFLKRTTDVSLLQLIKNVFKKLTGSKE